MAMRVFAPACVSTGEATKTCEGTYRGVRFRKEVRSGALVQAAGQPARSAGSLRTQITTGRGPRAPGVRS